MSRYRKIDSHIWHDRAFRALPASRKISIIRSIVWDAAPPEFAHFVGPMFRVADSPKRRPDLYSAQWRAIRLRIIDEQGTICVYCGEDCGHCPTVDHVRPVGAGADPFDEANLVVSCRPCNSRKGGREGWR